jgi:hypothetical protein
MSIPRLFAMRSVVPLLSPVSMATSMPRARSAPGVSIVPADAPSPSEEVVDDRAREMAKAQLDKNAARSAARRARELAEMTAKSA